ncbi:MAG: hypothetical protein HC930_16105 [Hydrococcus sp. SU_1_0]|nr:hypothetical protein [Hydrococcus sp. SU_1_0]
MFRDRQSRLSQLFQLRQELGIPLNAIIGHSEMIIAEINQDVVYLQELEQIKLWWHRVISRRQHFF